MSTLCFQLSTVFIFSYMNPYYGGNKTYLQPPTIVGLDTGTNFDELICTTVVTENISLYPLLPSVMNKFKDASSPSVFLSIHRHKVAKGQTRAGSPVSTWGSGDPKTHATDPGLSRKVIYRGLQSWNSRRKPVKAKTLSKGTRPDPSLPNRQIVVCPVKNEIIK